MNKITKTLAVAGANLLALGISNTDTTVLVPRFEKSNDSNQGQNMSEIQMRALEASHLEIYAACKWGHAAFDPIRVGSEELSPSVRAIYDQMAIA
jgi:hypothetical protein